MSAFERYAVARVVDAALAAGVAVPAELPSFICGGSSSTGARIYAAAHPDPGTLPPEAFGCCWGAAELGPEACTCWEPVYAVAQAQPRPPRSPGDLGARAKVCGDCAFHKNSRERATPWQEEGLFALADAGTPFWCHDGMRRPTAWRHPQLGEVPGDPDDWNPPQLAGIAYRADGSPALLCAGWMRRHLRALRSQLTPTNEEPHLMPTEKPDVIQLVDLDQFCAHPEFVEGLDGVACTGATVALRWNDETGEYQPVCEHHASLEDDEQ